MNIEKIKKEIKSIFVALVVVVAFKTFFFSNFHIPSSSMVPTLLVGDKLIIDKTHYGYSKHSILFGMFNIKKTILPRNKPEYSDIIVFAYPKKTTTLYIKRLIAKAGDKVVFGMDGRIKKINNFEPKYEKIDEIIEGDQRYNIYIEELPEGQKHKIMTNVQYERKELQQFSRTYLVPEGHFFASGDNRHNSKDSRFEDPGFIPLQNIVGKAKWIYFSSSSSIFNPISFLTGIRMKRISSSVYGN